MSEFLGYGPPSNVVETELLVAVIGLRTNAPPFGTTEHVFRLYPRVTFGKLKLALPLSSTSSNPSLKILWRSARNQFRGIHRLIRECHLLWHRRPQGQARGRNSSGRPDLRIHCVPRQRCQGPADRGRPQLQGGESQQCPQRPGHCRSEYLSYPSSSSYPLLCTSQPAFLMKYFSDVKHKTAELRKQSPC